MADIKAANIKVTDIKAANIKVTDIKAAILISGRGSNMVALLEAARAPDYPIDFVLVLSDQPEAPGLKAAMAHQVPTAVVAREYFDNKAAHEAAIQQALQDAGVELVALAGYMRLLSAQFVAAWADRIVNIHPSLLPDFPGLNTHARALEAGVKQHGCTVHLVTAALDAGPILGQAKVPVMASDDEETLAARVLTAEHQLYPQCLAFLAKGEAGPAQ